MSTGFRLLVYSVVVVPFSPVGLFLPAHRSAGLPVSALAGVVGRCRRPGLLEGKTKMEIIRCLKRYVAREVYPLLRNAVAD